MAISVRFLIDSSFVGQFEGILFSVFLPQFNSSEEVKSRAINSIYLF